MCACTHWMTYSSAMTLRTQFLCSTRNPVEPVVYLSKLSPCKRYFFLISNLFLRHFIHQSLENFAVVVCLKSLKPCYLKFLKFTEACSIRQRITKSLINIQFLHYGMKPIIWLIENKIALQIWKYVTINEKNFFESSLRRFLIAAVHLRLRFNLSHVVTHRCAQLWTSPSKMKQ